VLDGLGERSTNYRFARVRGQHVRRAWGNETKRWIWSGRIEQVDPHNGYLNYRLAHVLAELAKSRQRCGSSSPPSTPASCPCRCSDGGAGVRAGTMRATKRYSIAARRLEDRSTTGELTTASCFPLSFSGGACRWKRSQSPLS